MTVILDLAQLQGPGPIGPITIASNGQKLVALDFGASMATTLDRLRKRFGSDVRFKERNDPQGFKSAIMAYFAGDMRIFDTLPIDGGGSEFQRSVWAQLREIPAGETRSYGQIAQNIGKPGASRAVGLANGGNPIALVVPCHRVIGSNGALTGYAPGVKLKEWLLRFEADATGKQWSLLARLP